MRARRAPRPLGRQQQASGLLIARIGKQTFDVGLEAEITVPATGVLEMSCNGGDASQEDDDYLDVTIVVGTGDGD